jgi:hypothetical protein
MAEESTTPDLVELQRESFAAASNDGRVEWRFAAVGTWIVGLVVNVWTYSDIDEARATAERLAAKRG